ncbi:hypothetical protein RHMOL_Rhmol04G0074900 [Rhododendron molle]|uniref:Uncharacterized protein n=1 Tax=Rhododendron molle TaxID=49168 RepID=A0ACC0P072_RHOML|nr:hypothetical protein RHMOL_Rhmol04G0074900 [Rhododendron molle]
MSLLILSSNNFTRAIPSDVTTTSASSFSTSTLPSPENLHQLSERKGIAVFFGVEEAITHSVLCSTQREEFRKTFKEKHPNNKSVATVSVFNKSSRQMRL